MDNPIDLHAFLDEGWRHITRGVADSRSPARYPTFATVSPDGTPEARTLALRGASRSHSVLELHTDSATYKVVALQNNPKAAFHVWVPRANLQIRITVSVDVQRITGFLWHAAYTGHPDFRCICVRKAQQPRPVCCFDVPRVGN